MDPLHHYRYHHIRTPMSWVCASDLLFIVLCGSSRLDRQKYRSTGEKIKHSDTTTTRRKINRGVYTISRNRQMCVCVCVCRQYYWWETKLMTAPVALAFRDSSVPKFEQDEVPNCNLNWWRGCQVTLLLATYYVVCLGRMIIWWEFKG